MALQELSLSEAMRQLERLYQQAGDRKVLLRVLPEPSETEIPTVRPIPSPSSGGAYTSARRGSERDYSTVPTPVVVRSQRDPDAGLPYPQPQPRHEAPAPTQSSRRDTSPRRTAATSPDRRSPGREAAPTVENPPWQLAYRVPRDAFGALSPGKRESSPARNGRESPRRGDIPVYRYNPRDLTLSGPVMLSPQEQQRAPPPPSSIASNSMSTSVSMDSSRQNLMSPVLPVGDSIASRSARAHGVPPPRTWSMATATSSSSPAPQPQPRNVSPSRTRGLGEAQYPVREAIDAYPQQQARYEGDIPTVVSPPRPFHAQEHRQHVSPPRRDAERRTPRRGGGAGGGGGGGATTPGRRGTTPTRTPGRSTPGRTTPGRSHRYDYVRSTIARIPEHPVSAEVSPRRQKVSPFFLASSQPHNQGPQSVAISPSRDRRASKGIAWVV